MKHLRETTIYFLFGSTLYGLIELAVRNRTHWTMIIVGGIAFCGISAIADIFYDRGLIFKCFLGSMFVTFIELVSGIIINKIFYLNVWDYSESPLNIMGQVCPLFTLLWALICIPANILCDNIKSYIK